MLTGLSGSIESQHEQAHFSGAEQLAHHLGDLATHCAKNTVMRRSSGCSRSLLAGAQRVYVVWRVPDQEDSVGYELAGREVWRSSRRMV